MGSGLFRNQRSASTYVTRSTLGSASNTKRGANGVSVQQYSPRVLLGLTSFREVVSTFPRFNRDTLCKSRFSRTEKDCSSTQIIQRRSEEHTSELQSLMRISYAVFCLKKKNNLTNT